MQRHAVERQRGRALPLVDPEDARRGQRNPLPIRDPPCEPAAFPRLGRGERPEPFDRQRSVGPPHDGQRRAAGGNLAGLQGPRPEQLEGIDRESEDGEPDRRVRRRVRPGLLAGEPHVRDPEHRRPAAPVGVDRCELDLPIGDAAQPRLDFRAVASELGKEHPQPPERRGAEQRDPGERVCARAQQPAAEPLLAERRRLVAGAHGRPETGARRCAPPRRSRFRASGRMLRPRPVC